MQRGSSRWHCVSDDALADATVYPGHRLREDCQPARCQTDQIMAAISGDMIHGSMVASGIDTNVYAEDGAIKGKDDGTGTVVNGHPSKFCARCCAAAGPGLDW